MTPEERADRVCFLSGGRPEELHSKVWHQIVLEIRDTYEDAARIAEQSEVMCEHGCTDRIAALIRVRGKE